MTMYKELIARLRFVAGGWQLQELKNDAADAITALQAEVEMWKATANAVIDMEKVQLRLERGTLQAELNATEVLLEECKMDWPGDALRTENHALTQRVLELEGKVLQLSEAGKPNGKAVTSMEKLLTQVIHGDFMGDNPDDLSLALRARFEYGELLPQLAEAQAEIKRLQVEAIREQEPVAVVDKRIPGDVRWMEFSVLPDGSKLFAAPVVADEVPTEVTEVARVAIETVLREYNYPANPSNAARAGWRACRLHIAAMKGAA